MQDLTKSFSPTNNFWEFYPAFTVVKPFKQLYNSDKTRGKMGSSNIMWAIALCYHPKSDLYNLKDKEERVFEMVKDKSFKLEDYEEHIEVFIDTTLTQAEKSLYAWEKRLKNRDKFIDSQEYTLDYYVKNKNGDNILSKSGNLVTEKGTADQLDKMAANTPKLYQDYFKIRKELIDEEQIKGKGGKNLSLSDAGEI